MSSTPNQSPITYDTDPLCIGRPLDGSAGFILGWAGAILRSKPVRAAVAASAAAFAFNAIANPSEVGASTQTGVIATSPQAAAEAAAAQQLAAPPAAAQPPAVAGNNSASGEKLDNAGLTCLNFEITFDLNGCGKYAGTVTVGRPTQKSNQPQAATPSKSCDKIDSWLGKCGPNAGAKSGSSTKSSTSKAPTTSCDKIDNFLGKCVNGVPVPKKQPPWSNPDCNILQIIAFIDDCKKESDLPETPPTGGQPAGSW